ncbi:C6 transcription factor [Fonsecaea pedrosoi]|nr:C6 transcription factor [Fonsecaea pedrosoi]
MSTPQASNRVLMRSPENTPRLSRGPSLEPTFAEGHHISATSGVSFLYHSWNRGDAVEGEAALPSAPLTCHGDIPPVQVRQDQPLPTREEADALLERYFRFATPTYRFLHRPTLEKWTSHLLSGARLLKAEAACTLLVFSQSLLYTREGDRYVDGGDQDLTRSQFYFEKAKSLLNQEPGPASVASVQARLAMCLYLLSTFRINECRFCFSLACTILTSIGLHRKISSSQKLDLVTLESRKRTFWCAYVLDEYISVMLGRPRMLRDEDIDQPYPRNIDDQDLLSTESPEDLPLHGNLEAFIAHADLAKLMGRNSDLLYPIHPLSEDQLFDRTNWMLEATLEWKDTLPDFLKPRTRTLAGQRTFERQNTVLKLAHAHLRILATRRCLLADFSRLGHRALSVLDERALNPIRECASAISTILNTTCDLIQRGALYQSFWFTQYIALVAVSTLYVFVIQSSRANIPPGVFPEMNVFFDMAMLCQDRLAEMSPEGSQARRHCHLLSRLRLRAEKDAARLRTSNDLNTSTFERSSPSTVPPHQLAPMSQLAPGAVDSGGLDVPLDQSNLTTTVGSEHPEGPSNARPGDSGSGVARGPDPTLMGQFTPSDDDLMFQNLLGWGWESLDTVGFPGEGELFFLPA